MVFRVLVAGLQVAGRGSGQQPPRVIEIGPEAIQTVVVDSPNVLYSIGRETGLGSLENLPFFVVGLGPSRVILLEQGPNPLVAEFYRDSLVRTFGRKGAGPG